MHKRSYFSRLVGQERENIKVLVRLFQFVTGLDEVPPIGLTAINVEFSANDVSQKLPRASTCTNILYLPVCCSDYKTFEESMDRALQEGLSFGDF
ncbi:MAG: hypothetical protein GY696_19845 [Gammaproteobacteria bacterium]|nr:hypothetical protein [Gammaproteobacteria bacterium]